MSQACANFLYGKSVWQIPLVVLEDSGRTMDPRTGQEFGFVELLPGGGDQFFSTRKTISNEDDDIGAA